MVTVMIQGEERYMDGYMKDNLDSLKEAVARNWDGVLLFTGREGSGKTTLSSQCLAYLDPNFDLSRVCFTLEQVKELVDKLPPGSSILYDESWKDTSTLGDRERQREFFRILTEKRKKRFYWGVVSATFFDLKKFVAIHRTRVLINTYSNGLERGFWSMYDYDRKQDLYIKGIKTWDMGCVPPNLRGRFASWLPFDIDAYDAKKDASTKASEEVQDESMLEHRQDLKIYVHKRLVAFGDYLKRNQWVVSTRGSFDTAISGFLGVSTRTVRQRRNDNLNNLPLETLPGGVVRPLEPVAADQDNDNFARSLFASEEERDDL